MAVIEKQIAFKIRDQFPALYREFGQELVDFVEEYYHFLEEETNQSVYNARRLYEYRDVSTTLPALVVQFHKMFMADLPLLETSDIRFVVRNILDLYRRKGTPGGILLFFRMFYQEDVEIRYPASQMLKISDSDWRSGVYLQLFPNDNQFKDSRGNTFTYKDLIGRNIRGSISKARAAVDKINFVLINQTLTPVIYISDVKGDFIKYDDLLATINGREVAFGNLNGSASAVEIDTAYGQATTGNEVGRLLNIQSPNGQGGKVIVTEIENEFTGTVEYEITDGGFGYTEENTKLFVSSQSILLPNPDLAFELDEVLVDSANNEGIVTGQNAFAVGVYFANNSHEFDISRPIYASQRTGYPLIRDITANTGAISQLSSKNDSSPGDLYAITGDANNDVKVGITNIENVSLITDIISGKVAININNPSGTNGVYAPGTNGGSNEYVIDTNWDYNVQATIPFSGNTTPINLATSIDDAFDLEPFAIGTIDELININPGSDYRTDVWATARDEVMSAFDRFEQFIVLDDVSASMSKGDTITQANTGINSNSTVTGVITDVDFSENFLRVRPFSYYGFETAGADLFHKGNNYSVRYVSRDYDADIIGESAEIKSTTTFSSGKIKAAKIYESGLGYTDNEVVFLTDDDGNIQARATLRALSQGITSGYSASYNSHLNGYWTNEETGKFEYFDGNMKVQDSDYYQEYSYEIKGTVARSEWDEQLKRTVHLAGTKVFSDFQHKRKMSFGLQEKGMAFKFNQIIKIDNEVGGDPIVGPNQVIAGDGGSFSVDSSDYTVDTTVVSADATQEP